MLEFKKLFFFFFSRKKVKWRWMLKLNQSRFGSWHDSSASGCLYKPPILNQRSTHPTFLCCSNSDIIRFGYHVQSQIRVSVRTLRFRASTVATLCAHFLPNQNTWGVGVSLVFRLLSLPFQQGFSSHSQWRFFFVAPEAKIACVPWHGWGLLGWQVDSRWH